MYLGKYRDSLIVSGILICILGFILFVKGYNKLSFIMYVGPPLYFTGLILKYIIYKDKHDQDIKELNEKYTSSTPQDLKRSYGLVGPDEMMNYLWFNRYMIWQLNISCGMIMMTYMRLTGLA
jgi:hypothetical protein